MKMTSKSQLPLIKSPGFFVGVSPTLRREQTKQMIYYSRHFTSSPVFLDRSKTTVTVKQEQLKPFHHRNEQPEVSCKKTRIVPAIANSTEQNPNPISSPRLQQILLNLAKERAKLSPTTARLPSVLPANSQSPFFSSPNASSTATTSSGVSSGQQKTPPSITSPAIDVNGSNNLKVPGDISPTAPTSAIPESASFKALQPVAAFKIYLSYYQWDKRKLAINELADFLRSQNFEIVNDQMDYNDSQARHHLRLEKEILMNESDLVILCICDAYKRCAYCKADAVRVLKEQRNQKTLFLSTQQMADKGWLDELLPSKSTIIDFSASSNFADVATTVFRKIQRALIGKDAISTQPNLEAIKVKKRVGIPVKTEHYFNRVEERKFAESLKMLCEKEPATIILTVTGSAGIGKTALVQHILTDAKYDRHLALDCKIQNVAWCSLGSSLSSKPFLDQICSLVCESLRWYRYIPPRRRIGPTIDEAMVDSKRRFLLIVDMDENDHCREEVIDAVSKLSSSNALRCVLITRSIEQLPDDKKNQLLEFKINSLSIQEVQNVLKQAALFSKQFYSENALTKLAESCHGSPAQTDLLQYLLPRQVSSSILLDDIQTLMLKQFFENENIKANWYVQLCLFFGARRRFSEQDVAVLLDIDEPNAARFCSTLSDQHLLVRHEEDVFFLPEWLQDATSFTVAKSNPPVPIKVDFKLLLRAVEKRRESLLLYILSQTDAETLEKLCRDQSNCRNKATFLQILYSTEWRSVDCFGGQRNISAEILTAFLTKLNDKKVNTLQILTLPDVNADCTLCQIWTAGSHDQSQSYEVLRKLLWQLGARKVAETVEERRFWAEEARKEGKTSFFLAALRGQLQAVHSMIKESETKADLEAAFLAACANGNADVVRLLQWNGADVEAIDPATGDTALIMAARNGHCHVVAFLCQSEADFTRKNERNGQTALMAAARRGYCDVIHYLVEEFGTDITEKNEETGESAMMTAAKFGHISVVRLLVSVANVDYEAEDTAALIDETLVVAAENGQLDIVTYLLSAGGHINARDRKLGVTPLIAASSNGYFEIVSCLVNQGAGVTLAANSGSTALHEAARNNHFDIIRVLLSKDADPMLKNGQGMSAFMLAVKNGHFEIVECMVEKFGYDKLDGKDGTALLLAVANNHVDVADFLLKQGAEVNPPRNSRNAGVGVLLIAAQNCNVQMIELLLSRGANHHVRAKDGSTALILASGSKNATVEGLQLLYQNGCDLNAKTMNGWTCLMAASFSGNKEAVQWLVANGADINARTESAGVTALISAARAGHFDVVRHLVEVGGADVNVRTMQGAKAAAFAEACGYREIAQYLTSRGHRGSKNNKSVFVKA